jgi:DNA-binding XRE family transcriptional regulator
MSRFALDISQEELADAVGVARQTIGALEKNQNSSFSLILSILSFFKKKGAPALDLNHLLTPERADMDDDIDVRDREAERSERNYENHLLDMAERGL